MTSYLNQLPDIRTATTTVENAINQITWKDICKYPNPTKTSCEINYSPLSAPLETACIQEGAIYLQTSYVYKCLTTDPATAQVSSTLFLQAELLPACASPYCGPSNSHTLQDIVVNQARATLESSANTRCVLLSLNVTDYGIPPMPNVSADEFISCSYNTKLVMQRLDKIENKTLDSIVESAPLQQYCNVSSDSSSWNCFIDYSSYSNNINETCSQLLNGTYVENDFSLSCQKAASKSALLQLLGVKRPLCLAPEPFCTKDNYTSIDDSQAQNVAKWVEASGWTCRIVSTSYKDFSPTSSPTSSSAPTMTFQPSTAPSKSPAPAISPSSAPTEGMGVQECNANSQDLLNNDIIFQDYSTIRAAFLQTQLKYNCITTGSETRTCEVNYNVYPNSLETDCQAQSGQPVKSTSFLQCYSGASKIFLTSSNVPSCIANSCNPRQAKIYLEEEYQWLVNAYESSAHGSWQSCTILVSNVSMPYYLGPPTDPPTNFPTITPSPTTITFQPTQISTAKATNPPTNSPTAPTTSSIQPSVPNNGFQNHSQPTNAPSSLLNYATLFQRPSSTPTTSSLMAGSPSSSSSSSTNTPKASPVSSGVKSLHERIQGNSSRENAGLGFGVGVLIILVIFLLMRFCENRKSVHFGCRRKKELKLVASSDNSWDDDGDII